MSAVIAFDDELNGDLRRWVISAVVVTVLHAGLFAIWQNWPDDELPAGVAIPPIVIDMSPVPASPSDTPLDLAPGPQMLESDAAAASAEQVAARSDQIVAPVPPRPDAEVVLQAHREPRPSEDKEERQNERAKPKAQPRPVEDRKREADRKPAPRTSASPRAQHRAALASAQSGIVAANVLPSYRALLAAHLQRYKQYPAAERAAGVQGTPVVSFTISRSGSVLASRLARSSGNAALDAETLAMIRRAQPMPQFPPEITVGSMSFTVPISFSVR